MSTTPLTALAYRQPADLCAPDEPLRLALPKGRMQAGVERLLSDAGMPVQLSERNYRPHVALEGVESKLLKPQNIVEMLQLGSRDVGFAGADWVAELNADVVELLDTELNPVRIVAAAPTALLEKGQLPRRPLLIASEYERLTRAWILDQGLDARFVRSFGATEVFPPEDADCIVDNSATGTTLRDNGLTIVDELMGSSTRLYASPRALDDPAKRDELDQWVLLLRSVVESRKRVMVELNVSAAVLDQVIESLPCMRQPTIAPLHGEEGYAIKAAVPRKQLPRLICRLKQRGATDIVVSKLAQIVA